MDFKDIERRSHHIKSVKYIGSTIIDDSDKITGITIAYETEGPDGDTDMKIMYAGSRSLACRIAVRMQTMLINDDEFEEL